MQKSISDKLWTLYDVAYSIAMDGDKPKDTAKYGKELDDLIWGIVDGLYAKHIIDHIEGRCSVSASLKFDLGEEEKKIDKLISKLKGLAP